MTKLESSGHSGSRQHAIVSALFSYALVSGCSAGVPVQAGISARPSDVLQLSWAKAKRTAEGIVVSGQVQQVHCCRYLRGHIHVEATDENGASLASTNAPWGEFNPRQIHSAWFKAILQVAPQRRVAAINIQFSTESDK